MFLTSRFDMNRLNFLRICMLIGIRLSGSCDSNYLFVETRINNGINLEIDRCVSNGMEL